VGVGKIEALFKACISLWIWIFKKAIQAGILILYLLLFFLTNGVYLIFLILLNLQRLIKPLVIKNKTH
jgi:hypothetical protein